MSPRVLVAGVGNVFLGDDGFGVEVVTRLAGTPLPDGVTVADFGIRGVHLAYELLDGYDALVLVDAVPRGDVPGTLYVIEPDLDSIRPAGVGGEPVMDAHGLDPEAVLGLLAALGGRVGRVTVLGCEPADVSERMGLSDPVAGAVDEAVRMARRLAGDAAEASRADVRSGTAPGPDK
ncbi:MAG TPA: hydrogenase maturation protease [Mycobacteriales bacterium]